MQSKCQKVAPYNLREISRGKSTTQLESSQLFNAYKDLEDNARRSEQLINRMQSVGRRAKWDHLNMHLARGYPRIHDQFLFMHNEGHSSKVANAHPFDVWAEDTIRSNFYAVMSSADGDGDPSANSNFQMILKKAAKNVKILTIEERQVLLGRWAEEVQQEACETIIGLVSDAEKSHRQIDTIHAEIDRQAMKNADVIGLTTSGVAMHIESLQRIRCKIVICEEAGEVMEPHILPALLPSIEHIVQIGDHQQLRPVIRNFLNLSVESKEGRLHQLDRSQFERLALGHCNRSLLPIVQINVQRRMRPEISNLIRETIYKSLIDHESVTRLPYVVGFRKNLFWINHNSPEDLENPTNPDNKSKSNAWEIRMVCALVRHITRQGTYRSTDIAVLTPYVSQLQKLRKALDDALHVDRSDQDQDGFKSTENPCTDCTVPSMAPADEDEKRHSQNTILPDLPRTATVDGFQGEEAKIVIISLVRSNKNHKVGFLKTTNRINVLLSRAQLGMYILGNSETYANVPMWQHVIKLLGENGAIGSMLELRCPRHPDTETKICQPDDFQSLSPEGGCRKRCGKQLKCGHQCRARCHSQAMHNMYKCEQEVNNVLLDCGHKMDGMPCWKYQGSKTSLRQQVITKTLPLCQ